MHRLWLIFARRAGVAATVCLALTAAGPALSGELLAFPSIGGAARNADDDVNNNDEIQAAFNIFVSMEREPMQFLAEFVLNREEREVERLQIGVATASAYKIWVGRFHTPISFWNTAFHHGAFMQTTIARPGISEYEDGQGVMPMHTTGLLLEGSAAMANRQVFYDFALGVSPILKEALEPMTITGQGSSGKLSLSGKIGFQPLNSAANDEFGFFVGYTETPIKDRPYTRANQTVTGAYFNAEWIEWKFTGELTSMQNALEGPKNDTQAAFENIYIQGEYKAAPGWIGYGRIEESNNTHNAYLNLFPGFVNSRALVGARWEPIRNQAIKFEFKNSQQQTLGRIREIAVQWSMVYP